MGRAWVLVVVAGLAGCELVFPLEDSTVSGTFHYRISRIENGLVTTEDVPALDAAIRVEFDNSELIDVPIADDGSFRFERQSERYRFVSGINANGAEIIETSDRLTLVIQEAGRIEAEPVTQPTTILLPGTASGRTLVTVGQWSSQVANGTELDWSMTRGSGVMPIGLLDATEGDAIYLLQSANDAYATGLSGITAVANDDGVVMTDGGQVDLTGLAPVPVTANGCVRFGMRLGPDVARLMQASPGFGPPSFGVSLTSVPSGLSGFAGAFNLAGGTTTSVDADLDVPAHDPFVDHDTLGVITTLVQRPIALGQAESALISGITMLVEAPHGATCAANRIAFDPQELGLGAAISIDDQLLAADDQEIQIKRPGEAVVTWTADGRADFFDLTLFEVSVNGLDTLVVERRRQFRTREPRVEIDDTLLIPNHVYLFQVGTTLGFPGAAEGNYADFTYPVVNAATTSSLFIVR